MSSFIAAMADAVYDRAAEVTRLRSCSSIKPQRRHTSDWRPMHGGQRCHVMEERQWFCVWLTEDVLARCKVGFVVVVRSGGMWEMNQREASGVGGGQRLFLPTDIFVWSCYDAVPLSCLALALLLCALYVGSNGWMHMHSYPPW